MSTETLEAPTAPSAKQVDLIGKLLNEKIIDGIDIPDLTTLTGGRDGTASALISQLFAAPRVGGARNGTTKPRIDPTAGFYRVDGDRVIRIKVSKSGNWYAEEAVAPPAGSSRKSLTWDYLGKRIDMGGSEEMTEAEAGRLLAFCVLCNAELTDPESIARGMGPVCGKKF